MPTFDLRCNSCNEEYSEICRYEDIEMARCPKCKDGFVSILISSFVARSGEPKSAGRLGEINNLKRRGLSF